MAKHNERSMVYQEHILKSKHHQREFSVDVRYVKDGVKKPVILFIHGFKGFKDAMHFNVMADKIANSGFVYVKMNVSHNGTTPSHPLDFVDLEAFANNNFSIELDDMNTVIDWITGTSIGLAEDNVNTDELYLIGHSRGGSVSVLKACEDSRVKKLVTWAAVPDLEAFWPKPFLEEWKKKGTQYIKNVRTKQEMPIHYQMVKDFEQNSERFDISKQLEVFDRPFLAIHGSADETVPVRALDLFKSYNANIQTAIIDQATHTFGGKHPWESDELPEHSQLLASKTIIFFKSSQV